MAETSSKSVVARPRPSTPRPARPRPGPALPGAGMVRAAPGIARLAAVSAWNLVNWSIGATTAGAGYVARRAADGDSAASILQDAAAELRDMAWRALGLQDQPAVWRPTPPERVVDPGSGSTPRDLQRRGTDLLRQSNDVHVVEDTHPAFSRILSEITPDEARILRYLYLEGPQPSLDVRTFRPLGIGSELIASGLNMIPEHAGCRNLERNSQYMTNLARLGLIELSKEPVSNPSRYQVIEAQPKVSTALKRAGRSPKTVHRSIHLNEFGEDFVRTCLPLNGKVIPHREPPPDVETSAKPGGS